MKMTRKRATNLDPRRLRFTPNMVRALPELPRVSRKTLVDVALFVEEIQFTKRLSLQTSEVPTSLVFAASHALPLPDLSGGASRQRLVAVDLFVAQIGFGQTLSLAEPADENKTGPRILTFTERHALPLPAL